MGLMSVLVIMDTNGGHYRFEQVPFNLLTQAFGFERNLYESITTLVLTSMPIPSGVVIGQDINQIPVGSCVISHILHCNRRWWL